MLRPRRNWTRGVAAQHASLSRWRSPVRIRSGPPSRFLLTPRPPARTGRSRVSSLRVRRDRPACDEQLERQEEALEVDGADRLERQGAILDVASDRFDDVAADEDLVLYRDVRDSRRGVDRPAEIV